MEIELDKENVNDVNVNTINTKTTSASKVSKLSREEKPIKVREKMGLIEEEETSEYDEKLKACIVKDYTEYAELEKIVIKSPQELLEIIEKEINDSTDWTVQFKAIDKLRSVNKFQFSIFLDCLPLLIPKISGLTSNLKSNIAKNSLYLLEEVLSHSNLMSIRKFKESYLDEIIYCLLNESVNITKKFISKKAKDSLINLSNNAICNRTIQILLEKYEDRKLIENASMTLENIISNCSLTFFFLRVNWTEVLKRLISICKKNEEIYIKKSLSLLKNITEKIKNDESSIVKFKAEVYQQVEESSKNSRMKNFLKVSPEKLNEISDLVFSIDTMLKTEENTEEELIVRIFEKNIFYYDTNISISNNNNDFEKRKKVIDFLVDLKKKEKERENELKTNYTEIVDRVVKVDNNLINLFRLFLSPSDTEDVFKLLNEINANNSKLSIRKFNMKGTVTKFRKSIIGEKPKPKFSVILSKSDKEEKENTNNTN